MSTLSPIEPDTKFIDLEVLVCDAENMMEVLFSLIEERLSLRPPKDGYRFDAEEGSRIFFTASMALAMTRKARDAYYVAWSNQRPKSEKAKVSQKGA